MISTSPERGGFWRRLCGGVRRIFARPDWNDYAGPDWADRIMDVQLSDDFHAKQGRSTGRWLVRAGGKQLAVYLKRHERLSWWRGLLATLWPAHGWSPALHEAENLHWARAHGFPVPDVTAAGELIGPWGKLRSFLAVEELTGMLPLHEAIPAARARLDGRTFVVWKRSLTTELARLAAALHRLRRFHKDLYLCHFFVPEIGRAHV